MHKMYQKQIQQEEQMDEQEVKELTAPTIYSDTPIEDTVDSSQEPQISPRSVIGKLLSVLLCCISVLFFSVTAMAVAKDKGIDSSYVTRMLIGELVGGMDNVTVVNKSYIVPTTDSSQTDTTSSPSESVTPPPQSPSGEYTISLTNETPYSPDMNEIQNTPRVIPTLNKLYSTYGNDAPIVLILHTHGSEAYANHSSTDYRTLDTESNMIAIGKVISDKLNSSGVNTIHCETLFDAEDFNMAYYNASLYIRETISEFPSVSYIIDVHRDSVSLPDGTHLPLTSEVNGVSAAKLMFVIGTDHGGSGHTGWKDNLSLAARLQCDIHAEYPEVMRSINLRSASFNEQYTKGSLLLEVGSCANILEEAKISAGLFADALIREIIGD